MEVVRECHGGKEGGREVRGIARLREAFQFGEKNFFDI